ARRRRQHAVLAVERNELVQVSGKVHRSFIGFNGSGPRMTMRLYSHAHVNANTQAVTISTSRVPTNAPYVSCRGRSEATSAPRNWALNRNWKASRQTTAST